MYAHTINRQYVRSVAAGSLTTQAVNLKLNDNVNGQRAHTGDTYTRS